jgi:uncharacterized protein
MTFTELTAMDVIDAHVHVFPDRIFKAIRDWFDVYGWSVKYRMNADDLVDHLFSLGVKGQVLLTYAHKPGVADGLNDFMAGVVERHPGTVGFAAVHPGDADPRAILSRAFGELALVGCKMHVHVLGIPMDDPMFRPIYETCLDHGAWLNVHAGTQPALTSGYGMDVTRISGVERVKRVLARYPDLKLIVPHLGMDQTEDFIRLLDVHPNLYLDTTMVLSRFFGVEIDEPLIAEYSERIMYGSDFPNIPYEVTREVASILEMRFGEAAMENILSGTAGRLFGF